MRIANSPLESMTPPPLHGYRGDPTGPKLLDRPMGPTVAVSREAGARGWSIAKRVSVALGWQLFDQDQLDALVQDERARTELLAGIPDGARHWADDQLARLGRERVLAVGPAAVEAARLLLTIAARGEAVLVGRGAGFLLPPDTTVHVRVVAPLTDRVAYMGQWLRQPKDEAAAEVIARDQRRSVYLSHLLGQDPSDSKAYDLVVNSSRLGEEACADLIVTAVRAKQAPPDEGDPFLPDAA
jgi:Cytidylate kinase-like family